MLKRDLYDPNLHDQSFPDIPVTRAPLSMPQYHAYPDYSAGEAFAYTPGDDVHRDTPVEISNFYSSQRMSWVPPGYRP